MSERYTLAVQKRLVLKARAKIALFSPLNPRKLSYDMKTHASGLSIFLGNPSGADLFASLKATPHRGSEESC
jgi:hypothetical protein